MDRRGVLFLFFDLPILTAEDKRNYRSFKRQLVSQGYIQYQESVYIKLLHDMRNADQEVNDIASNAPVSGSVSILPITIGAVGKIKTVGKSAIDMSFFADDLVYV